MLISLIRANARKHCIQHHKYLIHMNLRTYRAVYPAVSARIFPISIFAHYVSRPRNIPITLLKRSPIYCYIMNYYYSLNYEASMKYFRPNRPASQSDASGDLIPVHAKFVHLRADGGMDSLFSRRSRAAGDGPRAAYISTRLRVL